MADGQVIPEAKMSQTFWILKLMWVMEDVVYKSTPWQG